MLYYTCQKGVQPIVEVDCETYLLHTEADVVGDVDAVIINRRRGNSKHGDNKRRGQRKDRGIYKRPITK